MTPIFVYTSYPSAEVFINGKSQGIRTKDTTVTVFNSADSVSMANLKRQTRYRLMWMETVYEPGTVRVVAYDKETRTAILRQRKKSTLQASHTESSSRLTGMSSGPTARTSRSSLYA